MFTRKASNGVTLSSGVRAFANPKATTSAEGAPAADNGASDAGVKIFAIRTDLKMPERVKPANRGFKSKYGFENLEIGQSIGVVGKTAAQLASTVSGANRRSTVNKTDASGAVVLKKEPVRDPTTNQITGYVDGDPEKVAGKHFFAVDAGPDDPDKATARIWRDK